MEYDNPNDWKPFPGVPRFFRRVWNPPYAGTTRELGDNTVYITPSVPDGGLVIYGFSARSNYQEDLPIEQNAWNINKAFPAICFSVVETLGEYGFVPVNDIEEITEEEFFEAKERNFSKIK